MITTKTRDANSGGRRTARRRPSTRPSATTWAPTSGGTAGPEGRRRPSASPATPSGGAWTGGTLGRALPRAVLDSVGDTVEAIDAATWAIGAIGAWERINANPNPSVRNGRSAGSGPAVGAGGRAAATVRRAPGHGERTGPLQPGAGHHPARQAGPAGGTGTGGLVWPTAWAPSGQNRSAATSPRKRASWPQRSLSRASGVSWPTIRCPDSGSVCSPSAWTPWPCSTTSPPSSPPPTPRLTPSGWTTTARVPTTCWLRCQEAAPWASCAKEQTLPSAHLRFRLRTAENLPGSQRPTVTLVITGSDQATRRAVRTLGHPVEHRSILRGHRGGATGRGPLGRGLAAVRPRDGSAGEDSAPPLPGEHRRLHRLAGGQIRQGPPRQDPAGPAPTRTGPVLALPHTPAGRHARPAGAGEVLSCRPAHPRREGGPGPAGRLAPVHHRPARRADGRRHPPPGQPGALVSGRPLPGPLGEPAPRAQRRGAALPGPPGPVRRENRPGTLERPQTAPQQGRRPSHSRHRPCAAWTPR